MSERRRKRWYYGLIRAAVLSIATVVKVIREVSRFFNEDVPWHELPLFAIWIGKPVIRYRKRSTAHSMRAWTISVARSMICRNRCRGTKSMLVN